MQGIRHAGSDWAVQKKSVRIWSQVHVYLSHEFSSICRLDLASLLWASIANPHMTSTLSQSGPFLLGVVFLEEKQRQKGVHGWDRIRELLIDGWMNGFSSSYVSAHRIISCRDVSYYIRHHSGRSCFQQAPDVSVPMCVCIYIYREREMRYTLKLKLW